ncbi:MAG: hypothetical protein RL517_1547 [Pseudomonadota bacterium]
MYRDRRHRQPAVLKLGWQAAVACAIPHLDEGFAATVDQISQLTKQSRAGLRLALIG